MPISFEEARNCILETTTVLGCESVSLQTAAGRVLAQDFNAPWALPLWDNSAMDGFALCAADAAADKVLKIEGYIPAGATDPKLPPVSPGIAVYIMTGAPTPPGCDLVVPIEETEVDGDQITLRQDQSVGAHVRYHGEDVKTGERILTAGTRLRPAEISLLASFNQAEVCVYCQPRVAILSTGDELVDIGTSPKTGQILNSNSYSLAAAVQEAGGKPILLGIARDNLESHRKKLAAGLKADVLVTSAGVSAGDRDLVRDVLADLGVEQKFWKVNIKPGRPTAFGIKERTLVFSLPGNPVSSMITFEEFVRPCLLKMQGRRQIIKPCIKLRLRKAYRKKPGRVQFLRVQVKEENGQLVAISAGDQNTGILSTLLRANAIAMLPAERDEFAAGESIDAHWLDAPTEL